MVSVGVQLRLDDKPTAKNIELDEWHHLSKGRNRAVLSVGKMTRLIISYLSYPPLAVVPLCKKHAVENSLRYLQANILQLYKLPTKR